ncbi:substrate-binding domain-containing protein [Candidatus Bealeia paramacronuclearis]
MLLKQVQHNRLTVALLLTLTLVFSLEARNEIRIVGSATVFPFAASVAEETTRQSGIATPIVEATGTGGGLKLFCQGLGERTPDIAIASRPMTETERKICLNHGVNRIFEMKIGMDGIALVSSKSGSTLALSKIQLREALAYALPSPQGVVKNTLRRWSDIDAHLPEMKITVLGPSPSSGTRDAFLELIMAPFCKSQGDFEERDCTALREDGGYVDAGENENLIVQKLISNPKLFGIVSFSYLVQNKNKLQAARIDEITPSIQTISSGIYPISRALYLYVKMEHLKDHAEIKTYLDEFMSDRASGPQGYLTEKGLIPLPREERGVIRNRITQEFKKGNLNR